MKRTLCAILLAFMLSTVALGGNIEDPIAPPPVEESIVTWLLSWF